MNFGTDGQLFTPLSIEMTKFSHAFDNGRFRLLWTFDDQKDMVTFHVKVQTTGWVAFGFALTAPNSMMNYDVVVAGYSNGQGYLNVSCLLNKNV